jgi:hypothetical protein
MLPPKLTASANIPKPSPPVSSRLEKPTDFSVPGKAKLIHDDVQQRFADRLEKPTEFTAPGKAKFKDNKLDESLIDKLENPGKHSVLSSTLSLNSLPMLPSPKKDKEKEKDDDASTDVPPNSSNSRDDSSETVDK